MDRRMRRKHLRAPSLSLSLSLWFLSAEDPLSCTAGCAACCTVKPPGSWSSKNHHREAKHDDSNVLRTPGCLAAQLELAGAPRPRRLYLLMIVSFDSSRLHSGHAMYKKKRLRQCEGGMEKKRMRHESRLMELIPGDLFC
jgi:hypothetical protein